MSVHVLYIVKGPRSVLKEDCPEKWSDKINQRKWDFSMEKVVGSVLEVFLI